MSVTCSNVSIGSTSIAPLFTLSLKWWYLIPMCFVLCLNLGFVASSNAPLLSSNTFHEIVVMVAKRSSLVYSSETEFLNGIKSLMEWLKAIYLASVVKHTCYWASAEDYYKPCPWQQAISTLGIFWMPIVQKVSIYIAFNALRHIGR